MFIVILIKILINLSVIATSVLLNILDAEIFFVICCRCLYAGLFKILWNVTT